MVRYIMEQESERCNGKEGKYRSKRLLLGSEAVMSLPDCGTSGRTVIMTPKTDMLAVIKQAIVVI